MRYVLACAVASLGLLEVACRGSRELETPPPPRPRNAAVACAHEDARRAALAVLERGGNATDAAIAATLALGVVAPHLTGFGGGGLAVLAPHAGEPTALDFCATSPVAGLAAAGDVGVPGYAAGLAALHERYGSDALSLRELVAPALELARDGFEVDRSLASALADPAVRAKLEADPAGAAWYPGGQPLAAGARVESPQLARTLESFARDGARAFAQGEYASRALASARLAHAQGRARNALDAAAMSQYSAQWRSPMRGWFRGLEVVAAPPPSLGGVVLLQVLGVVDGFPLDAQRALSLQELAATGKPQGEACGFDERAAHWLIEALRRAFAASERLVGDPDVAPIPVIALLSPRWLAEARVTIGDQAGEIADRGELARPELLERSRLDASADVVVIDERGNAIAISTTLDAPFGSGAWVHDAGYCLNAALTRFTTEPAAGERPATWLSPTLVRESDRRVTYAFCGGDGARGVSAIAAVLLRRVIFEQPLAAAVAAPRLHAGSRGAVELERGVARGIVDGLARRGHVVDVERRFQGPVAALRVEDDRAATAAGDPRGAGAED